MNNIIMDCDVRIPVCGKEQLIPYMSEPWKSQMMQYGMPLQCTYGAPKLRREPGSGIGNIDQLRAGYLEPHHIRHAILNCPITNLSVYLNIEYATATAAAYNDFVVDQWLDKADNGKTSVQAAMTVALQAPLAAAQEVERIGGHPGIAQLHVASATQLLYGQPAFHPLYEAAERHGLPICITPGAEGSGITTAPSPYGYFSDYFQFYSYAPYSIAAHMISLIGEGVFERFPRLKFVFGGVGFRWLPDLMWRLDQGYQLLRDSMPSMTRKPSETIRDHCYVTTNSFSYADKQEELLHMIGTWEMEHMLLFASGYPQWNVDKAESALEVWPQPLRRKIGYDNARTLYGLCAE